MNSGHCVWIVVSLLSRAVPIEQCCPLYPALRACGILAASEGGLTLL